MIINEHITASIVKSKLLNKFPVREHPRLTIEKASRNWFNNVLIIEESSDEVKDRLPEMIESKEPIPIDRILGEYSFTEQKIVIYKKSIELFSKHFKFDTEHVESIVRLHEYAHAIFHLGSSTLEPEGRIEEFIRQRTNIFKRTADRFHEWIAQCLCYSTLSSENLNAEKTTFAEMMLTQPKIYHIETSKIDESIDELLIGWNSILHDIREGILKEDDAMAWTV